MSELLQALGLQGGVSLPTEDLIRALQEAQFNREDVNETVCEELLDLFAVEDDGMAMALEACMVLGLGRRGHALLVMDIAADRLLSSSSVRVAHGAARIISQLLLGDATSHEAQLEPSILGRMLEAAADAELQTGAELFSHSAMSNQYYARTLYGLVLGHIYMGLGERGRAAVSGTEAGQLLEASLEVACSSPLQPPAQAADAQAHVAMGGLARILACLYPEMQPMLAPCSLKVCCNGTLCLHVPAQSMPCTDTLLLGPHFEI